MEPPRISWTLGYTLQPKAFESIRIDCTVSDYKHEDETITQASTRVYEFVENQLVHKLREAREELA
jgi:hypothetical protein